MPNAKKISILNDTFHAPLLATQAHVICIMQHISRPLNFNRPGVVKSEETCFDEMDLSETLLHVVA